MQVRSERKADHEAEHPSAIRQKIHMRIRFLLAEAALLYQSGEKYDKVLANQKEQSYAWQERRKLERKPLDQIKAGAMLQDQVSEQLHELPPGLVQSFRRGQISKASGT